MKRKTFFLLLLVNPDIQKHDETKETEDDEEWKLFLLHYNHLLNLNEWAEWHFTELHHLFIIVSLVFI